MFFCSEDCICLVRSSLSNRKLTGELCAKDVDHVPQFIALHARCVKDAPAVDVVDARLIGCNTNRWSCVFSSLIYSRVEDNISKGLRPYFWWIRSTSQSTDRHAPHGNQSTLHTSVSHPPASCLGKQRVNGGKHCTCDGKDTMSEKQ